MSEYSGCLGQVGTQRDKEYEEKDYEKKEFGMSDQENNKLTIVCPTCSHENEIPLENRVCSECKTRIAGGKFQKITEKAFCLGPTLAVCLSLGAGYGVMKETRLPVYFEYQLVNACVNGDARLSSLKKYKNKERVCACIVNEAVDEIDYTWHLTAIGNNKKVSKLIELMTNKKIQSKCS